MSASRVVLFPWAVRSSSPDEARNDRQGNHSELPQGAWRMGAVGRVCVSCSVTYSQQTQREIDLVLVPETGVVPVGSKYLTELAGNNK